MNELWKTITQFLDRGGVMIWPLLALSVIGLTLVFERAWFWIATNNPARKGRIRRAAAYLRQGRIDQARVLIEGDQSVYGRIIRQLLEEGVSEATVTDAVEKQRHRMSHYMMMLNTIITAAPMFGILGSVSGIIATTGVLSQAEKTAGIAEISGGIAESLVMTVAGLAVAVTVLFPYNAFRAQIERAMGLIDSIVAAVEQGMARKP